MRISVLALSLMPSVAMAHGSTAIHAHPHGAEGLIGGLALIALAAGAAWLRR
ncbi:hypothetical protein SAMN06273572_102316 [Monaibacterium marinum]|uniref:MYXO-CTERM domain-containing protein n=1 Tax=Pontivivens marinum TaxID=1690039 RepID=A0A2C9CR09_9RHOB|nr:hypothetical protein [Monaibacterium marinum]SOH93638.1 hypothetical protein SAMN06273572_102316 [Monaibacterium marinum]